MRELNWVSVEMYSTLQDRWQGSIEKRFIDGFSWILMDREQGHLIRASGRTETLEEAKCEVAKAVAKFEARND